MTPEETREYAILKHIAHCVRNYRKRPAFWRLLACRSYDDAMSAFAVCMNIRYIDGAYYYARKLNVPESEMIGPFVLLMDRMPNDPFDHTPPDL